MNTLLTNMTAALFCLIISSVARLSWSGVITELPLLHQSAITHFSLPTTEPSEYLFNELSVSKNSHSELPGWSLTENVLLPRDNDLSLAVNLLHESRSLLKQWVVRKLQHAISAGDLNLSLILNDRLMLINSEHTEPGYLAPETLSLFEQQELINNVQELLIETGFLTKGQYTGRHVPNGQPAPKGQSADKGGSGEQTNPEKRSSRQQSTPVNRQQSSDDDDDDDSSDPENQHHTYNNQCPLCQYLPCRKKNSDNLSQGEHPETNQCEPGESHNELQSALKSCLFSIGLMQQIKNTYSNESEIIGGRRVNSLKLLYDKLSSSGHPDFFQNLTRLLPQDFVDTMPSDKALWIWVDALLSIAFWAQIMPENGLNTVNQSFENVGFTNYLKGISQISSNREKVFFGMSLLELSRLLETFWIAGHKILSKGDFNQLMSFCYSNYQPIFPKAEPSNIQWLSEGGVFNPDHLWSPDLEVTTIYENTSIETISEILKNLMKEGLYFLFIEDIGTAAIIEVKEFFGRNRVYTLFIPISGTFVTFKSEYYFASLLSKLGHSFTIRKLKLTEDLEKHGKEANENANIIKALETLGLELELSDYFKKQIPVSHLVTQQLTEWQLKKKYHDLARIHHPDKHHGEKSKNEKFSQISTAYELLSSLFSHDASTDQ